MGVNTTNLLAGPGTLYRAPFGTTEPTDLALIPPAPWVDLGGTQDGLTLTINREMFELEVDQVVDIPGRRLTKRDVQLKTNLAEVTLENIAAANDEPDGSITTSGAGATTTKMFEPTNGIAAFSPAYSALAFDGAAPGTGNARRVFARRVLSIESIESSYKKDGQTLLPVTWACHYVSPSIAPYAIKDEAPVAP